MANNKLGAPFTPSFDFFIQYDFDKPVATTISNKKTGTVKERFYLTDFEMLIYGKMVGFHFNGEGIYISEQTLANQLRKDRGKIVSAIKSLENAGLISVVKSKGKSNHYKLLKTPDQLLDMCIEKGVNIPEGILETFGKTTAKVEQPHEATKQATQQPEKPEAMQSPSQPKKERRERRSDAGKREIDEHGYPVLTSDEMNDRWKIVRDTFKDKKSIKLSELRDTFYGPEVMDKIKGTIPDKIWKERDYWHLTEQALKVAKHVFKRGKTITIDYISHGYDAPRERLWNNCKLVNGELTITK
ncbi:TPA: helix-turn-helix domain-containing protein [Escherichia coli]|nr:helix-turn-helix domain-containing protein [Escherichia coli]